MAEHDNTPGARPDARAPLPPINFQALADALLHNAEHLVAAWLPGGVKRGHEWVCGGLSGGEGASCSINLNNGRWADFATGEQGGDLVSLYGAIHSLTMGKAAVQVARDEGLEDVAGVQRDTAHQRVQRPPPPPAAPKRERVDEGWATVRPVPPGMPVPTFKHHHRQPQDIEHTAEYRAGDDLHGYVVRFRTSDGGKETLPYTWCVSARTGTAKWTWRTFDEPRPLYLPGHQLPGERTVVLVEGEKKGDALQTVLDGTAPGVYCVASWPGGCKAWKKADWSWLAGRTVLLWPDCDSKRQPPSKELKKSLDAQAQAQIEKLEQQGPALTDNDRKLIRDTVMELAAKAMPLLPAHQQPGMAAMLGIGAHLRDAHGCTVQLLDIPPPGLYVDGWDCGDAINTDNWTGERVINFFGSAFALPADAGTDAPAPAAPAGGDGGGGKKTEAPAGAEKEGAGGEPIPWWLKPYWDAEKCRWLVSRKLVITALRQDESLQGILGQNLLSNNIEALRPWPWQYAKAGPVTGSVDLLLGQYLSDTYGLPSINRAALTEAIETVAMANPFHPVRDYLNGLVWDGTTRIDKWLIYVMGETPETLTPALRDYLVLVGRFWLLGMVNRVMDPGCKFDYCPVLEGPGGLGKSTLVEALASTPWFSDTHFDVSRGKEGQEQVQGLWVYEIAELANFGKSEVELIKAFISAKVDRYRPSYGRVVESYPRQCVLVGTTNQNTYLRDRTGNRRFWPVPVKKRLNNPWLRKWRDQLLAEAFALYVQGERFTPLPEEEARLFAPMQESRLVDTAVHSQLQFVLTRSPKDTGSESRVNELTEFVTMAQITEALGVDAAKSNASLEAQIRGWLEHEGWTRVKRMVNTVRAWGYVRPSDWPRRDDTDEGLDAAAAPSPAMAEADDAPF